jgi:four helix bundle protein
MAPYHTLKAWQHAERLAVECAKAAKRFPAYEQAALADQLRRAAYSAPLNIAEGSTRRGSREYRKFLDTANSSIAEVETALFLARELEYVSLTEYERISAIATEAGKTLFGLLRKVTDVTTRST